MEKLFLCDPAAEPVKFHVHGLDLFACDMDKLVNVAVPIGHVAPVARKASYPSPKLN